MSDRILENIPTMPTRPLAVSAVALIDQAGRVLMARRPAHKHHGGLWEYPGGKQEANETAIDAACREMLEELGVIIDPAALTRAVQAGAGIDAVPPGEKPIVITLYSCQVWQGVPACVDVAAIAWKAPVDLPALAMPPLDQLLTRRLLPLLSNDG